MAAWFSHIVIFAPLGLVSADDCLVAVNKYRGMAGKGAIAYCGSSEQNMAGKEASWDASHGFHNWVKTKGWSGMCTAGSSGQCEAEGTATQDGAIKMYYNEGPGGGHYDIMMSSKSHCVACGVSGKFYTHNFCSEGGSPSPPPPPPPSPGPPPPPPSPPSPSGGGISINAAGTSKCLDLPGGSTTNGNLLWLWDCNGAQSQSWAWVSGDYRISFKGDRTKCIDIPGGDTTNGNRLQIWDCNGHSNQNFGYDSHAKTVYTAWNQHVKCLDVNWGDDSGKNTIVQLWDCNGHSNQWWYVQSSSEVGNVTTFKRPEAAKPADPSVKEEHGDTVSVV